MKKKLRAIIIKEIFEGVCTEEAETQEIVCKDIRELHEQAWQLNQSRLIIASMAALVWKCSKKWVYHKSLASFTSMDTIGFNLYDVYTYVNISSILVYNNASSMSTFTTFVLVKSFKINRKRLKTCSFDTIFENLQWIWSKYFLCIISFLACK